MRNTFWLSKRALATSGAVHIRLIGRGRFRFIGFPLKIRGGTASPIRAVALFE
jgi:kynurenine formamidase